MLRDTTNSRRSPDNITLSTREKEVHDQLWTAADVNQWGLITCADAVPFFAKSGLPSQTLVQIWALADPDNKGVLGHQEFNVAVRLIAHTQNGKTPSLDCIYAASEPTVSDEDKAKYARIFAACGPTNGFLDGEKSREVFLMSKLPVDKLGEIWSLADTKARRSLDLTDFTIAMFYIERAMDGSSSTLPTTLPPSLLKAAAGPATIAGTTSPGSQPTSVLGNHKGPFQSIQVAAQKKGDTPTSRQSTGGSCDRDIPWEVTSEEKAKFDRYFDLLDIDRDGFVEGEEAVPFFKESKLNDTVLAQIWDLANVTTTGRLSRDEFAIAMHLISRANVNNAPFPETLPVSMVPLSLRARAPLSTPSSQNDGFFFGEDWEMAYDKSSRNLSPKVIEDPFGSAGLLTHKQQPSLPAELFEPPLTTSTSSSFQSNKANSRNGDLTILDTRFYQETKAVKDLQAKRVQLEEQISRAQDMRGMMEQRLSNLKTQKEREANTVKNLKTSLVSMELELSSLRMAIDVSKRELEVAQADKSSFLTALANGQEESLELKVVLQKNCDEVLKLKQDLESRMSMLRLDPLDFPGSSGGLKAAASQAEAAVQKGRVPRGPQFVKDDLILLSPRQRNPEFREPEPARLGSRGSQDHEDFQGAGLSKPIQAQPWHLLVQQESHSRK
ncbi:hypothetical protein BGZ47_007294 [Haplosporangium gracile]|nr:hypothetical protein BGZ47_007294 [Haplosporangium gracile]